MTSISNTLAKYRNREVDLTNVQLPAKSFGVTGALSNLTSTTNNGPLLSGVAAMIQQSQSTPKQISTNQILQSQKTNPESYLWRMIPGSTFSDGQWYARGIRAKKPPTQTQINTQKQILAKNNQLDRALQYISPLLGLANNQLQALGFSGIGPLTNKGSPLFLGRWYDPKTNRVKSFIKPKYVYNPTDYNSQMTHSLLNVVNKWNSFARAQDQAIAMLQNRPNWQTIVQTKQLQIAPSKIRKLALKSLLQKIIAGNVVQFNNNTGALQTEVINAFKQWSYPKIITAIENLATNYINSNKNLTPKELMRAQSLKNIRNNLNRRISRAQLKLDLRAPESLATFNANYNQNQNSYFRQLNSSNDMQSYIAKRNAGRKTLATMGAVRQLVNKNPNAKQQTIVVLPTQRKGKFAMTNQLIDQLDKVFNPSVPTAAYRPANRMTPQQRQRFVQLTQQYPQYSEEQIRQYIANNPLPAPSPQITTTNPITYTTQIPAKMNQEEGNATQPQPQKITIET